MTKARVFQVENMLAKVVVGAAGGKTVKEAVQSAEKRIESVRDRCVAALAGKADRLAEVAAGDRGAGAMATLEELYNVSNAIFGVAGTFELKDLGEATSGFCDMVDRFRNGEPVSWSAVDVYVDGIRLLSNGPMAGSDLILEGLRKVKTRFVPADA